MRLNQHQTRLNSSWIPQLYPPIKLCRGTNSLHLCPMQGSPTWGQIFSSVILFSPSQSLLLCTRYPSPIGCKRVQGVRNLLLVDKVSSSTPTPIIRLAFKIPTSVLLCDSNHVMIVLWKPREISHEVRILAHSCATLAVFRIFVWFSNHPLSPTRRTSSGTYTAYKPDRTNQSAHSTDALD